MNATRISITVAVFAALAAFMSAPTYAQRDAGAKMRGEFGTGFGRSASRAQRGTEMRRSLSYEPSVTVEARRPQERRSFSYVPTDFSVGDTLVTTADANIKRGTRSLGSVEKGYPFRVGEIRGPWVGARFDVDGKMIAGWIRHEHVDAVEETAPSVSQN